MVLLVVVLLRQHLLVLLLMQLLQEYQLVYMVVILLVILLLVCMMVWDVVQVLGLVGLQTLQGDITLMGGNLGSGMKKALLLLHFIFSCTRVYLCVVIIVKDSV